jgi:hypothetical protein
MLIENKNGSYEVENFQLPTVTVYRPFTLPSVEVPILEHPDAMIYREIRHRAGGLHMETWHTCRTVHCVAGWLVHLCGEQGYKLVDEVGGYCAAGALIYEAARPGEIAPSFDCCPSHDPVDIARYNAQHLELLRDRAAAEPMPKTLS